MGVCGPLNCAWGFEREVGSEWRVLEYMPGVWVAREAGGLPMGDVKMGWYG